jgi:hypothetical protein
MPGNGRYGARDFSNNQAQNFVLQDVFADVERGIPAIGKLVFNESIGQTVQVCIDTNPDPTLNGGGTWVDIGTFGGGTLGTITYVGGGTATYTSGTTVTPALPGVSLQDGDLLLCVAAYATSGTLAHPTFPNGWSNSSRHAGTGRGHALWRSLYRTGMSNPTLTFSVSQDVLYAQIFAYRNVRQSNPRLGGQSDGFSNSLYLPGSAQSTAQSIIQNTVSVGETGHIAPAGFTLVNFVVFWSTSAGVTVTTANGFTQRGVSTTTTGPDLSVGFADKINCDVGDNIAGWPIWTLASGTANPSVIGDVIVPANG